MGDKGWPDSSEQECLIVELMMSYIDMALEIDETFHIDPKPELRQPFAQYHVWYRNPNVGYRCAFYFRVNPDYTLGIVPSPGWGDIEIDKRWKDGKISSIIWFQLSDIADPSGHNIRGLINSCLGLVRTYTSNAPSI